MAQITLTMSEELKAQAEEFLEELGFDFATAFTVFARQAIRERRIPFDIDLRKRTNHDFVLTKEDLLQRVNGAKNSSPND
ncbi:MAG: type II toxin-antitoxin system RelB/DinJ family antitoxin [Firmicutes bacterium]|nr:type II toxin-antitoxin system RelB/DinJ family antitoxin [Bacillota bacterium]